MIVVSGATGNIGSEVLRQLIGAGHRVRALSRDPAKLAGPAIRVRLDQDHRRRRARNSAIQAAQRRPIQIGVRST